MTSRAANAPEASSTAGARSEKPAGNTAGAKTRGRGHRGRAGAQMKGKTMKQVYRNIVKGYSKRVLAEIAMNNAKKYNETWYILGDSQMAANDKGRKGYEQYPAIGFPPEGGMIVIEASPRS